MTFDPSSTSKIVESAQSIATLCENYFYEPSGSAVHLDSVQRTVFDVLETGDTINLFGGKVLRPHYYILMCWPRQFGKTWTIARFSGVAPVVYDDFHVGCYGPHELRSRIMLRKIKDNLKYSHFYSQVNWRDKSKIHLSTLNGSTVDSFNTSEMQIRGDTEDVCLIDEADYILNNELILDAIEPKTTIPRIKKGWGKMLLISTPNMQNVDSVFKSWYFEAVASRELYCKACQKHFPLSQFVSEKVPEEDFTIFDVPRRVDNCACGARSWVYFYNSDKIVIPVDPRNHPRISWDYTKAKLDARHWDPHARQEYLGEIVPGSGGMFPVVMLNAAQDNTLHNYKWPQKGWTNKDHLTSVGLDYGKLHDRTVISVIEKIDEHRYNLLHCYPVELQVETPTWEDIRDAIKPVITAWDATFLVPDATGIGNESSERMKADLDQWECSTTIVSNKSKHVGYYIDRQGKMDLVSGLEDRMKAYEFKMPMFSEPGMREVQEEFLNFGYEVTKAHNIIYRALKGHDDRVLSIMLAMAGFNTNYVPSYLEYTRGYA